MEKCNIWRWISCKHSSYGSKCSGGSSNYPSILVGIQQATNTGQLGDMQITLVKMHEDWVDRLTPRGLKELQEHQQQWPSLRLTTEPTFSWWEGVLEIWRWVSKRSIQIRCRMEMPTRFLIFFAAFVLLLLVSHAQSSFKNQWEQRRKHEASKLATATCCQTLSSGSFISSILVLWRDATLVVLVRFRGNNTRRSWQHNRWSICTSTLDQADLAVFLSHTKTSKHQPNHLGYSKFSHVFLKMCIYIPSILHMCYDSYHPSKTRTCFFAFFWGGGLFKVKPWTCRGAQITLEELEFWIREKVSREE